MSALKAQVKCIRHVESSFQSQHRIVLDRDGAGNLASFRHFAGRAFQDLVVPTLRPALVIQNTRSAFAGMLE